MPPSPHSPSEAQQAPPFQALKPKFRWQATSFTNGHGLTGRSLLLIHSLNVRPVNPRGRSPDYPLGPVPLLCLAHCSDHSLPRNSSEASPDTKYSMGSASPLCPAGSWSQLPQAAKLRQDLPRKPWLGMCTQKAPAHTPRPLQQHVSSFSPHPHDPETRL